MVRECYVDAVCGIERLRGAIIGQWVKPVFFDERVGFIPVSRVYFGVTNLGLSLQNINKIKSLTNYQ